MYDIINLPYESWDSPEQLGTKRKFWYRNDGQILQMFKEGRPGTGENWAEKAAAELADLLEIPHAEYQLATWQDHSGALIQGVVTPSFVPKPGRLVLGNEILVPVTNTEASRKKYYSQSYHTARAVMSVLSAAQFQTPLNTRNFPFTQPSDMFVGYVMFDAWIGNQDRHSENWGIILSRRGLELTPTYDHASSLGRNETDDNRLSKLETRDRGQSVDHYVTKARSALFKTPKDPKPLLTLDAFVECAKYSPEAAKFWLERLRNIRVDEVEQIFSLIPRAFITDIGANFALRMLEINKKRLLDTLT